MERLRIAAIHLHQCFLAQGTDAKGEELIGAGADSVAVVLNDKDKGERLLQGKGDGFIELPLPGCRISYQRHRHLVRARQLEAPGHTCRGETLRRGGRGN